MDIRQTVTGTYLKKVQEEKRNKGKPRLHTNATQPTQEITALLIQDDPEYADGAQLLIQRDTNEQLCKSIVNYDISTETRELKIQWAKLLQLIHAGRGPTEPLPPPFDQIIQGATGTILGKEI